jgi:hypothetical protein
MIDALLTGGIIAFTLVRGGLYLWAIRGALREQRRRAGQ